MFFRAFGVAFVETAGELEQTGVSTIDVLDQAHRAAATVLTAYTVLSLDDDAPRTLVKRFIFKNDELAVTEFLRQQREWQSKANQ